MFSSHYEYYENFSSHGLNCRLLNFWRLKYWWGAIKIPVFKFRKRRKNNAAKKRLCRQQNCTQSRVCKSSQRVCWYLSKEILIREVNYISTSLQIQCQEQFQKLVSSPYSRMQDKVLLLQSKLQFFANIETLQLCYTFHCVCVSLDWNCSWLQRYP